LACAQALHGQAPVGMPVEVEVRASGSATGTTGTGTAAAAGTGRCSGTASGAAPAVGA
jgi:hypothetical protein